jgi:hypothetical protein
MKERQPDNPPLSFFDVLADEYERQARTHALPPICPDGGESGAKSDRSAVRRERVMAIRGQLKKEIEDEKAIAAALPNENDRERQMDEELARDFYRWLHLNGVKRAALCFSGGGIRSATFGLGVLQGLAARLRLDSFHYVSTVSGGGYLGSWFSAWIHRRGMSEVQQSLGGRDLKSSAPGVTAGGPDSRKTGSESFLQLNPEVEPIRHLRSYSNYMSPRFGLLSADTWTLVAIFTRNLLLNWMVIIPLLLIGLVIPRVGVAVAAWGQPNTFAIPAAFIVSLLTGIAAVAYIVAKRPSLEGNLSIINDGEARNPADEADFLKWCLSPLLISAIAASTYWAWTKGMGGGFDVFDTRNIASPPSRPAPGVGFERFILLFFALGAALHLITAIVTRLTAGRPLELRRNFVMGALSGLLIWLLIAYLPARQFVLFGIVFHYLGVLTAQLWLEKLRLRDYLYAIFTGGLGGLMVWFSATKFFPDPMGGGASVTPALYVSFAVSLFLLMFLLAGTIFTGLASSFNSDADREWMARAGAWVLIAIVVWGGLSSGVIFGPMALLYVGTKLKVALVSVGAGSGVVTLLGGYSAKSAPAKRGASTKTDNVKSLSELAPVLAAPVFAASILIALSLGTTWLAAKICRLNQIGNSFCAPDQQYCPSWHLYVIYQTPWWFLAAFVGAAAAVALVMGLFVNINKFSLHAAYRDRLIRAYLGASRSSEERRANPFTGLDEKDNLQMNELLTDLFYADQFANDPFPNKFILRLDDESNEADRPVAEFLRKRLPRELFEQCRMKDPGPAVKRVFLRKLVDGLNRIIQVEKLQDEPCFKNRSETWSDEIHELLGDRSTPAIKGNTKLTSLLVRVISSSGQGALSPPIVAQTRVNRLLLETIYSSVLPKLGESEKKPRPLHVVNMALNLVAGKELAWRDRKAETYTASPLHVGNFRLGYRDSGEYSVVRLLGRAFSLGTAMAISGAAASPNMGYHSSPIVTFLLAFFNVRLGWWLGNPGKAGQNTYANPSPTFAPMPLIAETFGLTDDDNSYIYVSDGGHFENLGLYEMVLRRCHWIVVSDGSQDPEFNFESLGNAMSKIRVDLGIRITFDSIPISPREAETPTYLKNGKDTKKGEEGKKYCAIGTIHYSDADGEYVNGKKVENGALIYIKPAFYGAEPADVYNFARANPEFPHESTGDQMYSEDQFESYRALGRYEIDQITGMEVMEAAEAGNLENIFDSARVHVGEKAPDELIGKEASQPQ